MDTIGQATRNILPLIAGTILRREQGFALPNRPFKGQLDRDLFAALTELVEQGSEGRYTIRNAARNGVLYGYVQGGSMSVVLCRRGAVGTEEVTDRTQVVQAWYLVDGGLLPARFDCMPSEADEYFGQMNGR